MNPLSYPSNPFEQNGQDATGKLKQNAFFYQKFPTLEESWDKALKNKGVPLYADEAFAGIGDESRNSTSQPLDHIRVPGLKDADAALYVYGDSMEPVFHSGDIVAVQMIERPEEWPFGKVALVVSRTGSCYLKYLHRPNINNQFLLLSANPAHAPLMIDVDQVIKVYKVVARITRFGDKNK